jgi:hypothetical protein
MGRREYQENSVCTTYRRDQDLHHHYHGYHDGIRIRMYVHTFYNMFLSMSLNSILWSSPYGVSLTHSVV